MIRPNPAFTLALLLLLTLQVKAEEITLAPVPQVEITALEAPVQAQLKAARAELEQALEKKGLTRPQLANLFGELGKLYHAYSLNQAAKACYHNAGTLQARQLEWPYLYGYLLDTMGDRTEARNAYQYVLLRQTDHLPVRIRLARLLRADGEYEKAGALLQEGIQHHPRAPVIYAELGLLSYEAGRHREAVTRLTEVLNLMPQATRLHYPLAMSYRALGNTEKAREHLAKRGEIGIAVADPLVDELEALKQGERVYLLRGRMAYNAGDLPRAAEAFNQAVEASPESARAHINLGTALSEMGRYQEAYDTLQRALKLAPDNGTAHYNIGLLYRRDGQLPRAIEHLQRAVALDRNDLQAHHALAEVWQAVRRYDDALAAYQRVRELNPDIPEGWLGEISVRVAQRRFTEALKTADLAYSILPNNASVRYALTKLLAAGPDLSIRHGERAHHHAERLYRSAPTLANAELLALAKAEKGQCNQAAELMISALKSVKKAGETQFFDSLERVVEYYTNNLPCRHAPPVAAEETH